MTELLSLEEFDILLCFTSDRVEVLADDNVRATIEGLLKEYSQIAVKINWFSPGLVVIVPKKELLDSQ